MPDSDRTITLQIVLELLGAGKVEEAKKALEAIKDNAYEATQETDKTASASRESTKEESEGTKKLEVGKRELLESMRELNRQYPILGEVARAAFNPITIASFGVAEAITIWIQRLQTAQELLGGWQLPDFTEHTAGVSAAAEAYDKLKTAVAGADTEFNGAASAFERQSKAISAQLEATKQLIEAQKQKAVADLDIQRATGQVSPGTYAARKAMVEQGANDATVQAEIDARNADLAAKKQEAAGLAQQSATEAAKAGAIQPGRNEEAMQELINEAKAAADAAGKAAADLRAKEALAKAMRDQEGLESFTPESIGTQFKYDTTFGATTNPAEQAKLAGDAAKRAEEEQAALQENAKQLQKQLDERNKHTEEAASLSAEAEKKRLALAGEDDPNKVGSTAWQNAQAAQAQGIRDKAGEETQFSSDVEGFAKDAAEYKRLSSAHDAQSIGKARQAMADMYSLVADSIAIMQQLANQHENVSDLRRQIEHHEIADASPSLVRNALTMLYPPKKPSRNHICTGKTFLT